MPLSLGFSQRALNIFSAVCLTSLLLLAGIGQSLFAAEVNPDRTPRPEWAGKIPAIAQYQGQLPAEQRQRIKEFRQRFPQNDPSDIQQFHQAVLQFRQNFGPSLDDQEATIYAAWLKRFSELQEKMAKARGKHIGLKIDGKEAGIEGQEKSYSLVGFDGTEPIYSMTQNVNAAETTGVNLVRAVSSYDPDLTAVIDGSGIYVNINDHGTIYDEHPELNLPNNGGPRVLHKEINDSGDRNHMTHVAGTVGAWGYNSSVLGMAPRVWFRSLIQQSSSHVVSYGMRYPDEKLGTQSNLYTGEAQRKSVMGTTSLGSTDSNASRCVYTSTAAAFDSALYDAPYYIHFYAAGNDGGSYGTISRDRPVAKNVVTIGSVNDSQRDENGLLTNAGGISGWSSRGPAFDGRIKPDLMANGDGLKSTTGSNGTSSYSGTSMATPNAAGSTTLLIDYINEKSGGTYFRSSTLRALLINSADDLGNPGPDYYYGWGLINIKAAADIVKHYFNDMSSRLIVEDHLAPNQTWSQSYASDGSTEIRVTLSWIDPNGASQSSSSTDRSPRLVNDLQLRLIAPDGTTVHLPFVMPFTTGITGTPAYSDALRDDNASTGNNFTDVNEQIIVATPLAGSYTVEVSHAGSLQNNIAQPFSLAVSGLVSNAPFAPALDSVSPAVSPGSDNLLLTINGADFLSGTSVIFQRPGSPDQIAYGVIPSGNSLSCRLDAATMTAGYWDLVVRQGSNEIRLANSFLVPTAGDQLPPVFTSTPPSQAQVDVAFAYAITTSDADTAPASLLLSATALPAGLTFSADGSGGGSISGIPTSPGPQTFNLQVSDGSYDTYQIFTIDIANSINNIPPTGNLTATPAPVSGTTTTLVATASDDDNDPLSFNFAVLQKPSLANPILSGSGNQRTVTFNYVGTYRFEVTIDDGRGGIIKPTVDVVVSAVPTVLEFDDQ